MHDDVQFFFYFLLFVYFHFLYLSKCVIAIQQTQNFLILTFICLDTFYLISLYIITCKNTIATSFLSTRT